MKHPEQVKILSDVLIALSWLAIVFAIYGYVGNDLLLASTQWLLISLVLATNAIFFMFNNKK